MNLFENIRVAIRALLSNKLRALLTMLGIIIGSGAVVALMSFGNGATAAITDQIEGIGSNLITLLPGRFEGGGPDAAANADPLLFDDYTAVKENVPLARRTAPSIEMFQTIVYSKETVNAAVIASTPEYLDIRNFEIDLGRGLSASDNSTGARVAVIGPGLATELFGGLNPVGREIKINGVFFEVVGVTVEKGGGFGGSDDENVFIPIETGYRRLFGSTMVFNGKRTVSNVLISPLDADDVDQTMVEVERLMRRRRGLKLSDDLDFTLFSQNAFLDAFSAITATLTAFLGVIAGISLLVGGIGVMNIMLVSVTERTREIGLRKAVGARRATILTQFLIETMMLSLIGGAIGVAFGWGVSALVRRFDLLDAQVTMGSVILAFSVVALVGIVFGIYPAFRASRLSPIEALRYE